jgi:diacylglycerol kinase (ATP)
VRTLLLYNPISGRDHATRPQTVREICALLAANGYQPTALPTTAPGSAGAQARNAIAQGTELILACGGDGTVHDTLQGMVDPDGVQERMDPAHTEPRATLGVIPMGSANALARHLGLSTDPLAAARQILTFSPCIIPVGQVQTTTQTRYFTVLAGAGPDGALVSPRGAAGALMLPGAKYRLGRLAYYLHAAAIFATHRFPAFDLRWTDAHGISHTTPAVATMAVRIDSLGGLFHPLAPAANVHHPYLSLVAVRPPGWIGIPAWFAGSWLGQRSRTPLVFHAEASDFTITPAPSSRPIHIQADGEWIGVAPARIRLLPRALRLLCPTPPGSPNLP